jgi:hypothetical protein
MSAFSQKRTFDSRLGSAFNLPSLGPKSTSKPGSDLGCQVFASLIYINDLFEGTCYAERHDFLAVAAVMQQ